MTKIKDLKEKERLTQLFLIKSCTQGVTSKGAPYLNLIVQDNTGTIDGKLWDAKPDDIKNAQAGKVVELGFEVLLYNRALQLRVHTLNTVEQDTVDMSEFILSGAYTEKELREKLNALIGSIVNQNLRALVNGMFKRVDDRFYSYPAASRIHHSYLGGLAEHTLGMAQTAEAICELYPQLNRDILLSGVLVHDMGKTVELGGLISSEYTEEGKLIGHISICHGWLMEVADELGIGSSEEAIVLRHMILSHHGKQEFGSPILPATQEAEVLNLIDNLDARMNTLNQVLSGMQKGTWSQKVFALENRQFYKTKL